MGLLISLLFHSCCEQQKNSSAFSAPLISVRVSGIIGSLASLLTTGINYLRSLLLFVLSCLAFAVNKIISTYSLYSDSCSLASLSLKGVVRPVGQANLRSSRCNSWRFPYKTSFKLKLLDI